MKLLGLSCGRKIGSSEILLKEALMGAEAKNPDIEVEFIRLYDLNIQSCRFCKVCLKNEGGPEACVVKDDVPFIIEKFMQADGIIISAPVYILAPPGYLKLLADRILTDLAGVMIVQKMGGKNPITGKKVYFDERAYNRRIGGLISVGGAITPHWVSLGIPMMHCNTFPRQIELVDQMQLLSVSNVVGAAVLNEEKIKRAYKLGQNVAVEMTGMAGKKWKGDELGDFKKQAVDKPKWHGDNAGTCPVCHSDLLTVGKENPVECPICGSKGTISVEGNKIKVKFSKKEQAISRLTLEGKRIHQDEIRMCTQSILPRKEEIAKLTPKYESYLTPVKPTRKK